MRNLFLLLLAANLMFAGWQYFVRKDAEPGIERVAWEAPAPIESTAPEPEADTAAPETVAAVVENPESDETSEESGALPEVPAYAARCATIGPFETDAEARDESDVLSGQGLDPSSRSKNGQVFSGRWVYIDNVRNRAQSDTLLRRLQSGGMEEAYRIRDEETGGYVISLGVFSTENGENTVRERAEALGFEVAVEPRYRDVPQYWLDVQLESADAEAQVLSAYGESLVTLSDTTTCVP
ncbi:MAG: hypothetical protein AAGL69_10365 [Pseudomonadota bacterium]